MPRASAGRQMSAVYGMDLKLNDMPLQSLNILNLSDFFLILGILLNHSI